MATAPGAPIHRSCKSAFDDAAPAATGPSDDAAEPGKWRLELENVVVPPPECIALPGERARGIDGRVDK